MESNETAPLPRNINFFPVETEFFLIVCIFCCRRNLIQNSLDKGHSIHKLWLKLTSPFVRKISTTVEKPFISHRKKRERENIVFHLFQLPKILGILEPESNYTIVKAI